MTKPMTKQKPKKPHVEPEVLLEGFQKTLGFLGKLISCYGHDHPPTQKGDDPVIDEFFTAYAYLASGVTKLEARSLGDTPPARPDVEQ